MSLSSKTELARALFRSTPPDSVTRISGTATADSSDGTVTVQLEDGDVIEVGTIGSVTQGQTVTIHVQRGEAQVIASEGWGDAMQAAVDEAQAIAEATGQHFWHDSNGAHVTEVTQEQWAQSQTGHNILVNSLGILLRKALNYIAAWTGSALSFYDGNGNAASNVTASFGSAGAQIGKVDESHLEMDFNSMRLIDKDGNTYLDVNDQRDRSGIASVSDTFESNGVTGLFDLTYTAVDTSYTVTVDGVAVTPVQRETSFFILSPIPAAGAVVAVEYGTEEAVRSFTFGTRGTATVGPGSFSEGYRNVASGYMSHAEGSESAASGGVSHAEGSHTIASGDESHAEGSYTVASGFCSHAQNQGTIAQDYYQTALGRYNVADTTSALIIGNGTAGNARSNALTVDWSGNVEAAGGLSLGGKAVSAWVVETGTNNGWSYEKRSDGTYRAKWSDDLSLNSGTSWGGFYFHQQTAAINVPSFSTGFEVVSAVKNNAQLAWYVGRVASTTSLQGYWVNGNSGAATSATFGTVTYTIEGTY